jgi:hypothetical protein
MIGKVARMRAALGLNTDSPLVFLSQANAIYTGLETNKTLFAAPNPQLSVLLEQIQDATKAQQNMSKLKGAAAARDASFRILATSLESERMMVQALCDASPEQAATLIAAASMISVADARGFAKPLLTLKNGQPPGTVLVNANAGLLDSTYRRKTFHWQFTIDAGKSFSPLPSTPVARTSIANLTPLTTVGVQVSVTANQQPQGPWSQTVSILVR